MGLVWAFEKHLDWAAYAIVVSALFDFLDGMLARLLKAYSEIGKELDSLADVVSFGVLPSVIVFQLFKQSGTEITWLPYLAFSIAVFSALRLAKFNVDTRQAENFIGLPTPANALLFGSFPLIIATDELGIGAVIQQGVSFDTPRTVFSQFKFSQLAANFFGLQFLALNDPEKAIVDASTFALILSRLVFFDTILIPVLFVAAVFRHPQYLTKQKMLTIQAFLFFYGVVSQTTWNSTRQNIPFLACMGVLAVADIEHFRKIKAKVAPKLLMATR